MFSSRGIATPLITSTADPDDDAAIVFEWIGIDLHVITVCDIVFLLSECWIGSELKVGKFGGSLEEQLDQFLSHARDNGAYPLRQRLPAHLPDNLA